MLENALVQGRFWLPLHQEVEIRRTGTWLDFPARGIIRGRWEISDYEINSGLPLALFAGGPEIASAPPRELAQHQWHGRILDSLPSDVRAASDEDVRKVQEEARALVQQQALARAQGASLSARKISDFVRVNRVEGLALGAGASVRAGAGIVPSLRARYGFSDHALKGRLGVALRRGDGTRHRAVRRARLPRRGRRRRALDGGEQLRGAGVRERRHGSVRRAGGRARRGARGARRAALARGGRVGAAGLAARSTRAPRGEATSELFPLAPLHEERLVLGFTRPAAGDAGRIRDAIRRTAARRSRRRRSTARRRVATRRSRARCSPRTASARSATDGSCSRARSRALRAPANAPAAGARVSRRPGVGAGIRLSSVRRAEWVGVRASSGAAACHSSGFRSARTARRPPARRSRHSRR